MRAWKVKLKKWCCKKMKGHLWYLSEDLVRLSLFSDPDFITERSGDQTKWYWTKWYGQNSMDKMVAIL